MSSEDINVTFKVSTSLKFDLQLQPSLTVLQTKELAEKKCNIAPSRQRLIYRGRILKDSETLSSYSIANGHTIHLVESSGGQSAPTTTQTTNTAAQATIPPAAAAGTAPDINALMGAFNNAFGASENTMGGGTSGYSEGFPGAVNLQMFQSMMSNPRVMSMMQEFLRNPDMLRSVIEGNPFLTSMAQNNPMFQNILGNPDMMREAMSPEVLQTVMGMHQTSSMPTTTPINPSTTPGSMPTGIPTGGTGVRASADGTDFQTVMNRMLSNPSIMQQVQNIATQMQTDSFGEFPGAAGVNPFSVPSNINNPLTADALAPQMKQLEEMGFIDKAANLLALQRTGGDLNGAIAWLLESGHGS